MRRGIEANRLFVVTFAVFFGAAGHGCGQKARIDANLLLDLGVKAGIVEKSGSWFSYDSQRIGQGRENAKTFLRNNPDIAGRIEAAIRQNSGLIAEQILAGESEPGDAEAEE